MLLVLNTEVGDVVYCILDGHNLFGILIRYHDLEIRGAEFLFQGHDQFYQVEGPAKPVLAGATFPADKGLAGHVLQTQRSEVINDVQNDPRFYGKID